MADEKLSNAEVDAIHEAAAEWFTRLQDPQLSVDDAISWQSWISADERHGSAFRRIEETWHRFQDLPRPALIGSEALAADRYDGSIPVSEWQSTATSRFLYRRWRPITRRLAVAASIASVAMGALLALHFARSQALGDGTVIETGIGENRSIRLTDGSTVDLGGHTRLQIALDEHSRRITLARGEAYFTVAKDATRPFSVNAGSASVTALGTQFNVRRADDRVVVAVIEGHVMVNPRVPLAQQLPLLRETTSEKRRPYHLNAGNLSVVDHTGLESSTHLVDGSAATAWQLGRLDFDGEPLRYALESVNRYTRKPIELGDENLGDLRITGAALNDNIDGWVSSLESAFGLVAVEEPERIVLRRNR